MTRPRPVRLLCLTLLVGLTAVASIAVGGSGLPIRSVVAALAGAGDETSRTIVLHLRLPRTVLASLVGGGLALSGAVFQALLRNSLADPYVLGVSGGAGVGAVVAVTLGWATRMPWTLPLAAFAGAVLAITVVWQVAARMTREGDTRVLLLAGVAVGAACNSVILLLLTFTDAQTYRSAVYWMMGGFTSASWSGPLVLAAYLAPSVLVLLLLSRPLNLLAVGEETALYLGTRVERVKLTAYLVASLLVAASVAVSGVIGFVGLIVPHAVRLVWGSDHRRLLPASLLGGAWFLLVADGVARTVAAPAELPVGVVTALIGVPVFVVLLSRKAK